MDLSMSIPTQSIPIKPPRIPIIGGAMGIYGSPPELVKKTSKLGGIGVVSSANMDNVLFRILQLGDPGGHYKRAFDAFPDQKVAQRVYEKYYVPGGIARNASFKHIENISLKPSRDLIELIMLANFCLVWLAKEGHDGLVGINLLEKIQMPHLYALYGALLANLDYLFVGAGIPTQFPKLLEKLIKHEEATYNVDIIGMKDAWPMTFDPQKYLNNSNNPLKRPLFFPIISSLVLAKSMTRRPGHGVDGWVCEDPNFAGGHSAKNRSGKIEDKQPVYKEGKDSFSEADYKKLASMGLPFYIAGGCASPEALKQAQSLGAAGIQVASILALSADSGHDLNHVKKMRQKAYKDELFVLNSCHASPFGFPFRTVDLENTLGDLMTLSTRKRKCISGALLRPCLKKDSLNKEIINHKDIVYRCPAEPIQAFLKKGGNINDTIMKVCLCEGLTAGAGLPQGLKDGSSELAVFTLSNKLSFLRHLMSNENDTYTIEEALKYILSKK